MPEVDRDNQFTKITVRFHNYTTRVKYAGMYMVYSCIESLIIPRLSERNWGDNTAYLLYVSERQAYALCYLQGILNYTVLPG